jgi:hypothetical protein
MSLFGHIHQNKSCGYSSTGPAAIVGVCNGSGLGEVSMLCSRIAAGGFALVAVSVANASAQGCLLPWGCEGPGLSGSVKPRATGANLTRNTRNHLSLPPPDQRRASPLRSQQRLARRDADKMLDGEKKEPASKELRRHENESNTSTEQAARDALFNEFVRWRVHQVLSE